MTNLFPDADYRFQMHLERGSIAGFFRGTFEHEKILAERSRWLDLSPRTYAAMLPEGGPLLDEAIEIARHAGVPGGEADGGWRDPDSAWERCLGLGKIWEPDFLLLLPQDDGQLRLLGACVCFPSSWNLAEKIGQPLDFIHKVVPGLNQQIGPQIRTFLSRLKPGFAWLRSNWGLSRSAELNQHPDRTLPRLDTSAELDEIWLRMEHQALVALPRTQGVLFGIRIETRPVADVKTDAALARGLARALRTMPEEMARYKGIAQVREKLVHDLQR
jgi:hypothetical protein